MKYKFDLIFKAIVLSFIVSLSGLSFAAYPVTDLSYLPDTYVAVKPFSGGFAAVKDEAGKWGFINRSGKMVIPYKYDDVGKFSEKLVCVGIKDEMGNMKYGYIDKTGKTVIPFNLEKGYIFTSGMACVRRTAADGKFEFGYINKSGNLVIPYQYSDALRFSEGLACVLGKSQNGTLKYGYIDKKGNNVIPFMYDVAYSFSEGMACVMNRMPDGKVRSGYINLKNEIVIPLKYQDGFSFYNDYAVVMQDDNVYSVIDNTGTVIFTHSKGLIGKRSNDMIIIRDEDSNKWGYADLEGKMKVDFKYYEAYDYSEGLACVVEGMGYDNSVRKFGYIDVNGDMVISPQFDFEFDNSDFSQGFAAVKLSDGRYGFLRNPVTGGKIIDEKNNSGKVDKIIATPVNPVDKKTEDVVATKPVITKPVITKPVATKPVVKKPSAKKTVVLKTPSGIAKPLEEVVKPTGKVNVKPVVKVSKGKKTVVLSRPTVKAKALESAL